MICGRTFKRFKGFEIIKKYNSYDKYDFKKMVIIIEDLIINRFIFANEN